MSTELNVNGSIDSKESGSVSLGTPSKHILGVKNWKATRGSKMTQQATLALSLPIRFPFRTCPQYYTTLNFQANTN